MKKGKDKKKYVRQYKIAIGKKKEEKNLQNKWIERGFKKKKWKKEKEKWEEKEKIN